MEPEGHLDWWVEFQLSPFFCWHGLITFLSITFCFTGQSKTGVKYKGTVEVPNLSDENDMEDFDVSFTGLFDRSGWWEFKRRPSLPSDLRSAE